jgi:hypothetical protein
MEDSAVVILTFVFIGCFVIGLFLPAKKSKSLDMPFEVVVRARTKEIIQPKVIVKEVIRYVNRPRKSITTKTIKTTPALSQPTTPVPVYTTPIIKKRVGVPPIKATKPQVNKDVFNEAKKALMSLGYRAGDAKSVLESIGSCSTAEEYIRKAMTRTKK